MPRKLTSNMVLFGMISNSEKQQLMISSYNLEVSPLSHSEPSPGTLPYHQSFLILWLEFFKVSVTQFFFLELTLHLIRIQPKLTIQSALCCINGHLKPHLELYGEEILHLVSSAKPAQTPNHGHRSFIAPMPDRTETGWVQT